MRQPGEGRSVSFRVHVHLDGAKQATVTIAVAEMVASRVAKMDAARPAE